VRQPAWQARLTDVRLCRNQCVSTGPVDDGAPEISGLDQINPDDVATLREVQRLSQDEGINVAAINRILALESEVERLREQAGLLRHAAGPGRRGRYRRARG
jgi:hypothetical protein